MKICFTSDHLNDLDSVLSYHFGHCPNFVYVEMDGNKVVSVKSEPNPLAEAHNPGDFPGYMKQQGVDVIVTGGMGPKAQEFFTQMGIKPVIGAYGKVKDVLDELINGEVEYAPVSSEGSHTSSNEEIDHLNKEMEWVKNQLAEMKSMIKELQKAIQK